MAKLVDTYSADKSPAVKRRQLPLLIYDNLTMIMDLNSIGLVCDNPQVKGREYDEFMRKYKILTPEEVKLALWIDVSDILNVLNQSIPCVGCRRSVERLFFQLVESGHPTLDPLVVNPGAMMTIREDKINNPQSLATLLHGHSSGIECLVESQHRWRKSRRCALHSLEAGGARGWGCGWGAWGGRAGWRQAWDAMRAPCRDHVTLIHFHTLHDTLHNYLRKHRFCADCKTKVLRAYQLLVEEKEPQKEKGYVGALYGGIKRCLLDKHLHLQAKTEYIAHLIARAEPELLGNHRERHAKTLEIAQEEVLICLGMCVYERLHRISLRLREEEGTCQALAAVAVEALYRKFEMAVEKKSGVSKLELLYEEITQEEVSKQQRKEQKKLRKRKKKQRQAEESKCKEEEERQEEECQCEECLGVKTDTTTAIDDPCVQSDVDDGGCHSCLDAPTRPVTSPHAKADDKRKGNWSSSEHSQDCGYSSENNHCCETVSGSSSLVSSPEGSEVACSEGFCNHEGGDCLDTKNNCKTTCNGFTMSLQEMLLSEEEIEEDECLIPLEDVMEFKSRHNITEKRQELRQTLRQKFDQFCVKEPLKSGELAAGDGRNKI